MSVFSSTLTEEWVESIQSRIYLEVSRPFVVTYQFVTKLSYLYPFKGIQFFFNNYKPLLPIFLSIIIPYGIIHVYIYGLLLIVLFPLNLFIYLMCAGPLGFQFAIITTLQECSYLNNYILKNYLIPGKLSKTFDTVLCLNKLDRLVIPGKLKRLVPKSFGSKVIELDGLIKTTNQFTYIIFLSFVPIIGNIIINYNGSIDISKKNMNRMWKLQRLRPRQVNYIIKEHEGEFFMFGYVCQILESIPIIGLFFCFTDHIGAALFAADMYKDELNANTESLMKSVNYEAESSFTR